MKSMKKILMLEGGLQGLSFGESLYEKRDKYLLDAVSNDYAINKSRFFNKVHSGRVVDYDKNLEDIFSKEHYDVIVPMGDASAKYLSKNKNRIETQYSVKCAISDYEILSLVVDKGRFMGFCEKNGIPHPKTMSITKDTLEHVADQIGFPSLIKPDFSVGARGITKVNSLSELQVQYSTISQKYKSCTLQEYVDNPDYYYNVMIYRDAQGRCSKSAIIKIVRIYPIGAGSSSCCISVEDEKLLSICKDALDKLNWFGMADFDVLQRKDTLEYKIIEINPRVPASLRAAYISGVNFPETIVQDTLGEEISPNEYTPGKTLRFLGIDLLWFLKNPKRFHASPSWFRFIGKDIYYQDIFWKDRSTWYSWFIIGLKKMSRNNGHT
jgi:predicted ATP-grasp superfamily ATP-dependent carboligase